MRLISPKSVRAVFEKMTSDLRRIVDAREEAVNRLDEQIASAQQQRDGEAAEKALADKALKSFESLFLGETVDVNDPNE